MSNTGIVIIKNTLNERIDKFMKATNPGGKIDIKGKSAIGLQLINNVVNGSPKEPTVAPILTGRLRASGSAFVGNIFVGDTNEGNGTPNKNYSDNINTVTVGFNTEYAARWHENEFIPGDVSRQSGNVGNKYLEKHLQNDRSELMQLYADIIKKESSKL